MVDKGLTASCLYIPSYYYYFLDRSVAMSIIYYPYSLATTFIP